MKRTVTVGAMIGLLALGVAQTYAQTNTNTGTTVTVRVQSLNIALSGFAQNGATVTPVRINTKDVLKALGPVAANGTNFSSRARLIVSTDDQGNQTVAVREQTGKTIADTDVSGFFGHTQVMAVQRANTGARGKTSGVQYSIDQFMFGSSDTNSPTAVSFSVQGFTTSALANGSFVSQVNGTGNVVDKGDAVLRGSINGGGGKSETHTTGM